MSGFFKERKTRRAEEGFFSLLEKRKKKRQLENAAVLFQDAEAWAWRGRYVSAISTFRSAFQALPRSEKHLATERLRSLWAAIEEHASRRVDGPENILEDKGREYMRRLGAQQVVKDVDRARSVAQKLCWADFSDRELETLEDLLIGRIMLAPVRPRETLI